MLNDLHLGLPRGAVTAIVGPNGAGKSTLLAALSGAIRPFKGKAILDGREVTGMSPADLAKQRAVLEQSPARDVPFPVADLIGLAIDRNVPPAHAAEITARALTAFDLIEHAKAPVSRLSGGEAHRAHLARTMAQLWAGAHLGSPGYLLIDEPTASLDMAHQRAVLTAARDAAKEGSGVLIILHDLTLAAAVADRVIVLHQGRIAADGAVPDVLTPAVLEPIYGIPIAVLNVSGQTVVTPLFQSQPSKTPEETGDVRSHESV
ncbi:MAG: ATP-binding cassette domain-containing protein [Pseudomonadota bacterium]